MKACKECKENDGYIVYEGMGIPCDCLYGKYKELLSKKPRFYLMDINNYNEEFLIQIIQWQEEYINFFEKHKIKVVRER